MTFIDLSRMSSGICSCMSVFVKFVIFRTVKDAALVE